MQSRIDNLTDDLEKQTEINRSLSETIAELQSNNQDLAALSQKVASVPQKTESSEYIAILKQKSEKLSERNKMKTEEIILLKKEIDMLKKRLEEQIELYEKDKVEGKQQLGLSRIEFFGGNGFSESRIQMGNGLGEIGEEEDEDNENASPNAKNLRISQLPITR